MTASPPITTLPSTPLITAEQFGRMPNDGTVSELVRGRIVRMPSAFPFHGSVCFEVALAISEHVRPMGLGRVLINDSGVVTERDPDTVRGPNVAFYSKARLPAGELPRGRYLETVPELVVEVRSPSDRWQQILQKVSEYLSAGVSVVVVIDPSSNSANVYRDEGSPESFGPEATLTIPDLLPGFSVPVARFFQ